MRAGGPLGTRSLRSEPLRRGAIPLPVVVLAAAALAGTSCAGPGPAPAGGPPDAHAAFPCAQCHVGALPERRIALATPESCARSGCHEAGPGQDAAGAGIRFVHADHDTLSTPAATCSGCHAHEDGDRPLSRGLASCGLCHADALDLPGPAACTTCHADPAHAGVTSQGVEIEHADLPWPGGDCVRCHYDVSPTVDAVEEPACVRCHADVPDSADGSGLHDTHGAAACASCHTDPPHRIVEVSSSVALDCGACHRPAHQLSERSVSVAPATCNGCHLPVHAAEQRLYLGLSDDGAAADPSVHFAAGLTCASCHLSGHDVQPGPEAPFCSDCHRSEMDRVAGWWRLAADARVDALDRYVREAEAALAGHERARTLLDRAAALSSLVRTGRGVHNPPAAHHALADAVELVREAYGLAGVLAPPRPGLGTPPTPRSCASCHWAQSPPSEGGTLEMNDPLHRDLMRPPPPRR